MPVLHVHGVDADAVADLVPPGGDDVPVLHVYSVNADAITVLFAPGGDDVPVLHVHGVDADAVADLVPPGGDDVPVLHVHGVDADAVTDQPGGALDVPAVGGPPLPGILWQLLPHAHGNRPLLWPGPLCQELWPALHLSGDHPALVIIASSR